MVKRGIATIVALVYLIACCIMLNRGDYPWAAVQFALSLLAYLTAIAS